MAPVSAWPCRNGLVARSWMLVHSGIAPGPTHAPAGSRAISEPCYIEPHADMQPPRPRLNNYVYTSEGSRIRAANLHSQKQGETLW